LTSRALEYLSREELDSLLDHLDSEDRPCDETFTLTRAWAEGRDIVWSRLELGLQDAGAGCDCEVLANVDPDER
jgi:hypothetical protein